MTAKEIADLLSVIAGFDRRTIGPDDVEAWRLALDVATVPNLALSEAVDAVVLHYQDSREWIMPADILKRIKARRAEALSRALPPAKPNPGAYARVEELLAGRSKAARDECNANRGAVLQFPDLYARLTEPPIGYARADQWTGYIPPEQSDGSHNGSARRAALAALVAEARARLHHTREDTP